MESGAPDKETKIKLAQRLIGRKKRGAAKSAQRAIEERPANFQKHFGRECNESKTESKPFEQGTLRNEVVVPPSKILEEQKVLNEPFKQGSGASETLEELVGSKHIGVAQSTDDTVRTTLNVLSNAQCQTDEIHEASSALHVQMLEKEAQLLAYERNLDSIKLEIEESLKQKAAEADARIESKMERCRAEQAQLKRQREHISTLEASLERQLAPIRESMALILTKLSNLEEKVGKADPILQKSPFQIERSTEMHQNLQAQPTDSVTPRTPKQGQLLTEGHLSPSLGVRPVERKFRPPTVFSRSPEHFTTLFSEYQSPKRDAPASVPFKPLRLGENDDTQALLETIKQRAKANVSRFSKVKGPE